MGRGETGGSEGIGRGVTPLGSRVPHAIDFAPVPSEDHAIILKEGTSTINVRPYRYPQAQKFEIKRLVQEMLAANIIQLV